jgi:hypothetical protein
MAMLLTHTSDRVYVSAANAKGVVRLRIGPSEHGAARIAELRPSEARKIALFLLQSAQKMDDRKPSKSS